MRTKRKIFMGVVLFTAVLAVGVFVWVRQPLQATIAITGQSGLTFTGIIKEDGVVTPVSGIVPTNFVVTGRSVDCRFQKQQVEGALGIYTTGKRPQIICSAATSNSHGGVCAFFHSMLNDGSYTF
jgi:hypothetical protein